MTYKKLYEKRGEQLKNLIAQIETHVDLKTYLEKENAELKACINAEPPKEV